MNEKESGQAHIPHAQTLHAWQSCAHNEWQCHAFGMGQSDKKNHNRISVIIGYTQ